MFFILFATKTEYFSFQVGSDLVYQSVKKIENFPEGDLNLDFGNDFRLDFGHSWRSKYKGYFSPFLTYGARYDVSTNWSRSLESNFGLFNLSGIAVNIKMLTQHRTGVFFGAGIEIDLHWAIPQTVTEVDLRQGASKTSTATLKGKVSSDISPLISVGYHLTLRKNLALRFEASALFSVLRSPATSYKIYLKGEKTPLAFKPYIDYKKPIKLRFSTGLTVYLS